MIKFAKSCTGAAAILGLLTSARAGSLLTSHATVLACSDCDAPGMPPLTTFGSSMSNPAIAEDGSVLFLSNLAGPNITTATSRALYRGTTMPGLSVVARWSDPAPGLPGIKLVNNAGTGGISTTSLRLSPDGRSFFFSSLTNSTSNLPTTSDTADFAGFPGSLAVVAREGDPAPGTAGAVFSGNLDSSNQFTAENRNGRVLFLSSLSGGDVSGTTNDQALYTGTPGALTIAVRKGDTMLAGPVKAAAFSGQLQMENTGRILYNLQLSGTGVTTANDQSLWVYTPGSGNTMLVREGSSAPGTAGAVFANTPSMSVNSLTRSGRYEFVTDLAGGDVVAGVTDRAIYIGTTSGGLTLVSRRGAAAPGTNAHFESFHPIFSFVNDAGLVAFQGTVGGGNSDTTNNNGIWAGTPGSLSLAARAGDVVPGTMGATIVGLNGQPMAASDYGILFTTDLTGGDVFPGINSHVLMAWTPSKGTFVVARSGEVLEVSPGVFKTAVGFGFLRNGNTDGAALGLSNSGKIAMNVNFDPGTSVVSLDLNCYPATNYYLDADGDGHGDPATEINLCAGGVPPPGYITTAGDCHDSDPNSTGASPEVCNGIDDDCNAKIDDGILKPTGVPNMTLGKSGTNTVISWAAVPRATKYDIVAGDLIELRNYGDFQWLSQAYCPADDYTFTSLVTNLNPSPGNGYWWIMRPLSCGGLGSYDEGTPDQVTNRDREVGSTSYACP